MILWRTNGYWTYNDVKKKMVEHYVGRHYLRDITQESKRKLDVVQTTDTVGQKIIYFTLNGSPPKGYATWRQSSGTLTLFNPQYKIWREYSIPQGVLEK